MPPEELSLPDFFARYERSWRRVAADWAASGTRGWLTYSANYLFQTGELVWGVDPFMPYTLLGAPYPEEIPPPLRQLDVILLTHQHPDHWDEKLYCALADRPRVWLVPEFLAKPLERAGVPSSQMTLLAPGGTWSGRGMRVIAHEGRHKEAVSGSGPDSLAWEVLLADQRFLFFGDVRNYDPALFPDLPKIAASFAHVWLGRGEATAAVPSMLEAFCRFHESFQPERLFLTHLNERSRAPEDRWTPRHAEMVQNNLSPKIRVRVPELLTDMFARETSAT